MLNQNQVLMSLPSLTAFKQLQAILSGLGTTLSLAILSFALAMIVGILFGMMSVSPYKTLRIIASIFVDVVRGIPLMIVAAFIFWASLISLNLSLVIKAQSTTLSLVQLPLL